MRATTAPSYLCAQSPRAGETGLPEPGRLPPVAAADLQHQSATWGIRLADGRVVETGSGRERTEADASWENTNPGGRGGCTAVVRDSYVTPWRRATDPAPAMAAGSLGNAAELAALRAQVGALTDSAAHYYALAIRYAPPGESTNPAPGPGRAHQPASPPAGGGTAGTSVGATDIHDRANAAAADQFFASLARLGATLAHGSTYVDATTAVLLVCGAGHRCSATPSSVDRGQPLCPTCVPTPQ